MLRVPVYVEKMCIVWVDAKQKRNSHTHAHPIPSKDRALRIMRRLAVGRPTSSSGSSSPWTMAAWRRKNPIPHAAASSCFSSAAASPAPASPAPAAAAPTRRRRRRRNQPEYDGGPINDSLVASLPNGWADVREEVKQHAESLGFARARVTTPEPASRFAQYRAWVEEGQHGEMAYLAREDRLARRADLDLVLPGVQAVLCTMTLYWPGKKGFPAASLAALPPPPATARGTSSSSAAAAAAAATSTTTKQQGVVSCYSWGQDYHDLITPRLQQLAERTHTRFGGRGRWYVDTGPLMERDLAERAGLGFVGKNTLLINEQLGSGTFLAELLTTLPLPADPARKKSGGCGSCSRCIQACPTQAIAADGYSIDARRCISYLTIENKGSIPLELRPKMGSLIYGCDICQQVCPWNRWSWPENTPKTFFGTPPSEVSTPMLGELLLQLRTDVEFKQRFVGSPVQRIGRARLLRNVAVAIGNSGEREHFLPVLRQVQGVETDPLVLEHVAWAIQQLEEAKA